MKRKILVIEDDMDIAELVKLVLETEEYTVETILDPLRAVEKAQSYRPDAILLDLLMPKIGGWEIFKALRKDPAFDEIPIAILTAKSEEFDSMVGLHVMNADAYITKPFGKQELINKTNELFKKSPNRNILIVDDEPDVLDVLRIYLESQQWNVTTIKSPTQAFELLEQKPFFLVMTDIAMPDIDGYEFINVLQENQIPAQITLMTGFGYNPKHTLVKINKKYRYPVFFKPFEFKKPKLKEMVQKAWEEYHQDLTE